MEGALGLIKWSYFRRTGASENQSAAQQA